jgi:acyl dehydratase
MLDRRGTQGRGTRFEEPGMDGPQITSTWEALVARVGTEVGLSGWIGVDQPLIDAFAKATGDEYFLHVDPSRAAAESPFGGTIAHGMLTLSLLPRMSYEVCPFVVGARYPLNYGYDRVRFVAPVPVGSRVRGRFALRDARSISPAQRQLRYDVTVEIEGATRPALVAEWITRVLA